MHISSRWSRIHASRYCSISWLNLCFIHFATQSPYPSTPPMLKVFGSKKHTPNQASTALWNRTFQRFPTQSLKKHLRLSPMFWALQLDKTSPWQISLIPVKNLYISMWSPYIVWKFTDSLKDNLQQMLWVMDSIYWEVLFGWCCIEELSMLLDHTDASNKEN